MVYNGILIGNTVRLRAIEEQDAEISYKMRTDIEKSKYIHQDIGTIENQRDYIKRQRQKQGDYYFVVEDLRGNPIGLKALYGLDIDRKEIESGRFIGFGSQIQNIEALKLGFDFAFDFLKVDQITMSALEGNTWMLCIQKRFGAEYTHRHYEDGMPYDNIYSVLTRKAYSVSKPKVEALISRFSKRT